MISKSLIIFSLINFHATAGEILGLNGNVVRTEYISIKE